MKFRIEVKENETAPFIYGLAYRDYARDIAIGYPIPLNWIVRFFRNLYFFLAVPKWGLYVKRDFQIAFEAGRRKGFEAGYAQSTIDTTLVLEAMDKNE